MKKILLLLMVLALSLFMFIGCGEEAAGDEGENGEAVENEEEVDEEEEADEEEASDNMYQDGTYTAYSDANERGFGTVTITIENDEIVDVELAEFRGTGVEKDEDYGYDEFHDALEEMPGRFQEANSADVEAFTGATSSSEKWMQGVERALEMALVDAEDDSMYFDGTFFGASDLGERGRSVAFVTIENDEIVEVVLHDTQLDDDGGEDFKEEDYGYDEYHEAREELAEEFVAANSADVDAFTGATSSSENWMTAVERALENAER